MHKSTNPQYTPFTTQADSYNSSLSPLKKQLGLGLVALSFWCKVLCRGGQGCMITWSLDFML